MDKDGLTADKDGLKDAVVDIVTDNAGYELFTDMCLADFLISTGKASLVNAWKRILFTIFIIFSFFNLKL